MPQIHAMTLEEEVAIGFPLQPYLAKIAKDYFGADCLIKTGWNLSAAEAEFGPDRLNK